MPRVFPAMLVVISATLACGERGNRAPGRAVADTSSPTPAPLSAVAISESLGVLLAKLPSIRGELQDPHEFVGDMTVLRSITDLGDSAVARLVDCLDHTMPSAVTYKGRQVSVGLLCYVALDRTAYYEAYDERPDDSHRYDPWPGSVTYSATPEQLRHAKRAWKDVVRRRAYHLT